MSTLNPILPSIKIALTSIDAGNRVRKELGNIEGFAESIREVGGLIHPVAIDDKRNLVAGGRRYAAYTLLHSKFPTEGWGLIPVTLADTENSMTKLRMLELEENIQRKDMTWKEKVSSIVEIHNLHQKEAFKKGDRWALRHTGQLLNVDHTTVSYCLQLHDLLKDPKHPIQNADGVNDAFRILLQLKEDEANRKLAMMTLPSKPLVQEQSQDVLDLLNSLPSLEPELLALTTPEKPYEASQCVACTGTGKNSKGDVCPICKGIPAASFKGESIIIPLSQMFLLHDSIVWCKSAADETIDHICTDPPYAINMDNLEQQNTGMSEIERVRATHDVGENLDMLEEFIPQAFRILRPNGFCVLWCDYMHFRMLHDIGQTVGFRVQRWPLIWCKTGPAMNQAAQYNFTKDHECAIVMRKGGTLVTPQSTSYLLCGPADKKLFPHPFAKPVELWKWVLRAIAIPGQTILDPFAGSGSGCYAAAELGLRPFGIEKEEVHFCNLINTMRSGYVNWMRPKTVEFK